MGYRIVEAGHGAEALGHIDGGALPDLLLVDVVLPGGMSGRDLVDRAMGITPGLKALYMSGHSEEAIMHHGRLDHGVKVLEKPFSRADLAASIRRTLDQP
jgi:CheY-like chemotaxis protein